jgi:hypothetical protein
MYRNGRGVNQQFGADELLYMRFSSLESHNTPSLNDFKFPDASCNRSWEGGPEDCVIPNNAGEPLNKYEEWGILYIKVADVPKYLLDENSSSNPKPEYEFDSVHDPLENNYSHCEIRMSRRGGIFDRTIEPTKSGKKLYRRSLQRAAIGKLIRNPSK